MKKIYDFRKTKVMFNKGYYVTREDWVLSKRGRPITRTQKEVLKMLGWDYYNYTKRGANVIITAILNA